MNQLDRRRDRLKPGPTKRVLSLDGGGVRGLLSLGILKRVETLLRNRYGSSFLLCDYFDLIGGTSTGALIATLLALGYDVETVKSLYDEKAEAIFRHARWFPGIRSKFNSEGLRVAVRSSLSDFLRRAGRNPEDVDSLQLDSDLLRTGLAIVSKRIDSGAVWILTNNPRAKYWDGGDPLWKEHYQKAGIGEFYANAGYPLATLVQASSSAPFYLDGVELKISPTEKGLFMDGGVTPFNNPCQELFLMTTLKAYDGRWNKEDVSPYGFNWETGADRYLMLSIGTGMWRPRVKISDFQRLTAVWKAKHALETIMFDTTVYAVAWMQAISEGASPWQINSNVHGLESLRILKEPLLHFRRVDATLDAKSLSELFGGKRTFSDKEIETVRQLDAAKKNNRERLTEIGNRLGERELTDADFPAVFDVAPPVAGATA